MRLNRSTPARSTRAHATSPSRLLASTVEANALFCPLEARKLLAFNQTFTDVDGDQVTLKIQGNGTGAITFDLAGIDALTLTGTDANSKVTLSVKTAGGGNGRVNMDLGALLTTTVKSFEAPALDVNDSVLTFSQARSVRLGAMNASFLNVDAPVGLSLAVTLGNVTDSEITTTSGGTAFVLISTNPNTSITEESRITSMKVSTSLRGSVLADNYGSITVGQELGAQLIARTPDPNGFSFGDIKVGSAFNAGIGPGPNPPPGGGNLPGKIKSLTVSGLWTGGGVRATSIGSLKVTGDFTPQVMQVSEDQAQAFSVKTVNVGGNVGGTWSLGAPISSWKSGTLTSLFDITSFGNRVDIKSMTINGDVHDDVDTNVNTIGTFTVKGTLSGEWNFFGQDSKNRSVATLKANRLFQLDLDTSILGGIGTISFGEIQDIEIASTFIGTLSHSASLGSGEISDSDIDVTGADAKGRAIGTLKAVNFFSNFVEAPNGSIASFTANRLGFNTINALALTALTLKAGGGFIGNVVGTTIVLTGNDGSGRSSKSIKIAASLANSGIYSQGNIDSISLGSIEQDSRVFVGRTSNVAGDPANASDFAAGTLKSLTIGKSFDAANPAFISGWIAANTISSFTIKGAVELTGPTHGLAAVNFNKTSMKNATGQTIKPVVGANGDTNPLAPTASTFVLRRLA